MSDPTTSLIPDWLRHPTARKRIGVVHAGPIGLATAMLLARRHDVVLQDARAPWVDQINAGDLPPNEPGLQDRLIRDCDGLRATTDLELAVNEADYVFVTTPTRFDKAFGLVNTTALDTALQEARLINPGATLVLASNPPVGYTQFRTLQTDETAPPIVLPTPLRPGHVFQDRWHPQRLVIGECSKRAVYLALLLRDCLLRPGVPYVLTHATEAEAVFLFEQKRALMGGTLCQAEVARYASRHGLDLGQILEALAMNVLQELGHVYTPDRMPWAQTVPYRPDHPATSTLRS